MTTSNPPLTAHDVSEMLLARTGDAMLAGDFQSFMRCFHLPYEVETVDGHRSISTPDALHATFNAVHAYFQKLQVAIMARHCVSASFRADDEVAATHETRLIDCNGIIVQDPYPAFSILKRSDNGEWKILSTSYVIVDSDELNGALNG
ncbi:MAG: hypothetical protein AB3N17_14045 [Tateyamaria sp.]